MSESEIEASWFDEAERRAREIDQRLMRVIPAEEISCKVRDLLKCLPGKPNVLRIIKSKHDPKPLL